MDLINQLKYWRAERPDEWKMDEFIRLANELISERDQLRQRIEAAERQAVVEWQYQSLDGTWNSFLHENHRIQTIESRAWNIRKLYALPPTADKE